MGGVKGREKMPPYSAPQEKKSILPLVGLAACPGQENRAEAILCVWLLTQALKKPKAPQEAALHVLFHLLILDPCHFHHLKKPKLALWRMRDHVKQRWATQLRHLRPVIPRGPSSWPQTHEHAQQRSIKCGPQQQKPLIEPSLNCQPRALLG